MVMTSLTQLIVSLSLISQYAYSQQTVVKTAILSPHKVNDNGADVIFNFQEVSMSDMWWDVNVMHQNSWQFIIKADETFGIDTTYDSTISFTVNIPKTNTKELLFAFTTDNKQYISMSIPTDGSLENTIYPACSSISASTDFGFGDIASIPSSHRRCDISGGSCNNWQNMLPLIPEIKMETPITFTIKNDIIRNEIIFSLNSFVPELTQKCRFAQDFVSKKGLKIYIAGDAFAETYSISSFNITSSIIRPTTYSQTQLPTYITEYPTSKPSDKSFTKTPTLTRISTETPPYNPTDNTITPSRNPSTSPIQTTTTLFPSVNPTQLSTLIPTIPFGFQLGAHDQLCKKATRNIACETTMGTIQSIAPYDGCMCKAIECGLNGIPCTELSILGEYGIYGIKEVYILGDIDGVSIECSGSHSCANTLIRGINIGVMECDGNNACQNAQVMILNPTPDFVLNCGEISSCEGLKIDIILSNSNTAECNKNVAKNIFKFTKIGCGAGSCEGLQITIENNGCDKVIIQDLECNEPNACNNAVFNFIGDIAIENCHCGPSCDTVIGLDQCFMDNINLYKYVCGEEYQCAQQQLTIENPRNGFEFICSSTESCRDSNFIIELNRSPYRLESVEYLGGIKISGDYSAQGATFLIHNAQGFMTMNKIECNGYRSCEFATFITGTDTEVNEISCADDACSNCYIKRTVISDGVPCDSSQVSSFQQI